MSENERLQINRRTVLKTAAGTLVVGGSIPSVSGSSNDSSRVIFADDFEDGNLDEYNEVGIDYPFNDDFGYVELVNEPAPDGGEYHVEVNDYKGWGSKYLLVTKEEYDFSINHEFKFLWRSDQFPNNRRDDALDGFIGWGADGRNFSNEGLTISLVGTTGGRGADQPFRFLGNIQSTEKYEIDWEGDQWYWVSGRVDAESQIAEAKIWKAEEEEPEDHQISAELSPDIDLTGKAYILSNGDNDYTDPDRLDIDVAQWNFVEESVEVDISIKPDQDPNPINPNRRGGVIPVAVLNTGDFDPNRLDVSTLRFGDPEVVKKGKGASPEHDGHFEDVDDDDDKDLLLHFPAEDTGFDGDEVTGRLEGQTDDGTPIFGTDTIKIVGAKGNTI